VLLQSCTLCSWLVGVMGPSRCKRNHIEEGVKLFLWWVLGKALASIGLRCTTSTSVADFTEEGLGICGQNGSGNQ